MDDEKDQVTEVIERALLVEVNGGELEPIWDIYKPEGVALVIRQALADAGLLADADLGRYFEMCEDCAQEGRCDYHRSRGMNP